VLPHNTEVVRRPQITVTSLHPTYFDDEKPDQTAHTIICQSRDSNSALLAGDTCLPIDKCKQLYCRHVPCDRTEFKIACITYKVLTTGQPTYLSTLLNHYTPLCVLYVQLISTFCSTRGFLLSLPRGRLVTSHLKFGTTYPSISSFALPYQPSNVISKRTYLNSILHFIPAILLT